MKPEPPDAERTSRRRRARWIVLFVAIAICIAFLPAVIVRTSLRDAILQSIIGDPNLHVTSSRASFGWISPLVIDDLKLLSADGTVDISVDRLHAERSWLSIWWTAPEIGHVEVDQPRIAIIMGDDDANDEETSEIDTAVTSFPTFSVELKNGDFLLRESEDAIPVVDAKQVDLSLRTEQRSGSSVLIIDAINLADHEKLSPEVCDRGIQLVAPQLSDEIALEGEYSVELTKMKFVRRPDASGDGPEEFTIEGVVTLHHVTGGLKNDVTQRLAMMAAELMELGDVPKTTRLIEDARLSFQLTDGSIRHQGTATFLTEMVPGLSLTTSGSVGVNEELDLQISLHVPRSLLRSEAPLAKQLSETPLELQLSGTVDEPLLAVPETQAWMTMIQNSRSSPESSSEDKALADDVASALTELLDQSTLDQATLDQPMP